MAKSEKRFKYQGRTREDIKERANQKGSGFDTLIKSQYKMYKVKDGKNVLRVMPPTWDGARHYGFDVFVVYGVGPDKQGYLSLSKMGKGKDPLDEARRQAVRDGDEDLDKELSPRKRVAMWVIDRLEEDEGPQIFVAPITVDTSLANICTDDETNELILIDDPEDGRDWRFYRTGQGLKTKYDPSKMKLSGAKPLCEDEKLQKEWLDYISENPIPECLQFYDYAHISAVLNGTEGPKDEDDAEDRRQAKKRLSKSDEDEDEIPKRTSRTRMEPVDDDEEEADTPKRGLRRAPAEEEDSDPPPVKAGKRARVAIEEDEDEEPPPVKTKPKAGKRPVEDEDDIPFDDDDEDEELPEKEKGESIGDRLKRRRMAAGRDDN